MSHIALSATSSLPFFSRSTERLSKIIPVITRCYANKSSLCANSLKKGFSIMASASTAMNGGVAELSENEQDFKHYIWPDKKRPRVCILGGGFGGLYTVLRLESLVWPADKRPQVLLIDQSERFVFKPMLYELLSGEVDEWEIAPRFEDLLANTEIQFIQDRVKHLKPSQRDSCPGTVELESDLLIEYDWLVIALGAEPRLDIVPGAVEYALPFSTFEDACKVNDKLKALERKNFGKGSPIRVVIVGCGYSGVELAATVSERLQSKGIVQAINAETTICPTAPPGNREAASKVLSDRNVQLSLGYLVNSVRRAADVDVLNQSIDNGPVTDGMEHNSEKFVVEIQPTVRGLDSQTLEADIVLWTVGNKPRLPELEPDGKRGLLPLNGRGQAETDETLRVKGHPRIFALGDSSGLRDSSGKLLPATAQVAFQEADFAGWNIWAAINDRPLLPFRYQNLGEMMTLGRSDAAVTPSFIDGLTLEGPVGHAARKLAYLIRLPTDEHRLKVGLSWFTKTAIDSVASLQSSLSKVLSGS
ncbi:hypothetical protein RND81_09G233700 [Saponaria officinalis]|uniref:demethylphylloquinone reductase n=1 Tax=Saponaria officinalis TaxID=3572 RepID=A0AAW1IPJ1_SAPOF